MAKKDKKPQIELCIACSGTGRMGTWNQLSCIKCHGRGVTTKPTQVSTPATELQKVCHGCAHSAGGQEPWPGRPSGERPCCFCTRNPKRAQCPKLKTWYDGTPVSKIPMDAYIATDRLTAEINWQEKNKTKSHPLIEKAFPEKWREMYYEQFDANAALLFAVKEVSTHLTSILSALKIARKHARSQDDKDYWKHEQKAHADYNRAIRTALEEKKS